MAEVHMCESCSRREDDGAAVPVRVPVFIPSALGSEPFILIPRACPGTHFLFFFFSVSRRAWGMVGAMHAWTTNEIISTCLAAAFSFINSISLGRRRGGGFLEGTFWAGGSFYWSSGLQAGGTGPGYVLKCAAGLPSRAALATMGLPQVWMPNGDG